jgi:hypothetical protein
MSGCTNDLRGSLFTFGNTEATMARNPFLAIPPAFVTNCLRASN